MTRGGRRAISWVGVLLLGCVAVSCFRDAINSSPELRFWLFANFGASKMCPEMLKRGAPLKLVPNGNTIGRFFPSRCQHEVDSARQTITVHLGGTGYAWTPVAGRMGFSVDASVEYRPDFYLGDEVMYVWARLSRIVQGPNFQIGSIENKLVNWAAQTPVGYLANTFGAQVVTAQLASGFTVVRTDAGDAFTLGILQPPARPQTPFSVAGSDRYTFFNETAEIRNGQVDFIGPLEIAEGDQALFFRFRPGGPRSEALLMRRFAADTWRDGLQRGAALGPPPEAPIHSFVLEPGQDQQQKVRLPVGEYVLVIDNSAQVGSINPPWNPLGMVGGGSVVLSYIAQVGDAD